MPLPVTAAHSLTWRGVGDPGAVRFLLHTIPAIGKKRSAGYGHILDWTVTTVVGADPFEHAHLHPTGVLGRTAAPACLSGRPKVSTGHVASMGLRPPYMHPHTRRTVALPVVSV